VVSDNASTDHTPQVLGAAQKEIPYLRVVQQAKHVAGALNFVNAYRNALGKYCFVIADDDAAIPEAAMQHIATLEENPNLVAIYTDWIAFDDEHEREMHRYIDVGEATVFSYQDRLSLLNFVFSRRVLPEIAVYRSEDLRKVMHAPHLATWFHQLWMYKLLKYGDIEFSPEPFYLENRILKRQFRRREWANIDSELSNFETLRTTLENLSWMVLQDLGGTALSEGQARVLRGRIEDFSYRGLSLAAKRAKGRGNWILANELMRRHLLWKGAESQDALVGEHAESCIRAALQGVKEMFEASTGARRILLYGFASDVVPAYLKETYPSLPQEAVSLDGVKSWLHGNSDPLSVMILVRYGDQRKELKDLSFPVNYVVALDELIHLFALTAIPVNLESL
jgi:glycosyltransferase involved in cell wall biosynthesis